MRFRYNGPHDAVDVPELGVTVERGGTVEASAAVATSLEKSPAWQRVDRRRAAEKATPPAPAKKATPPIQTTPED